MSNLRGRDYVDDLNNSMPAAKAVTLGTLLQALITKINQILDYINQSEGITSLPGLSRGSTDTAIASVAFRFMINGVNIAKTAVAAGTAIGAQTVTADKWALYRLSIQAGGTITVTPAAGNVAGYATEAAAIAAMPATPANEADMGYVTLKTKAGQAWIAATDGLAGGTSGNVASITNYHDAALAVDVTHLTSLTALP